MIKRLSILILLILALNLINAQQWISFNDDTLQYWPASVRAFYPEDSIIYVGGGMHYGGSNEVYLWGTGIWDNNQWQGLDNGVDIGGGVHIQLPSIKIKYTLVEIL